MTTSETIKERELPLSGQPVCNALAPAVCSMPSGPVSDAARHFTAHWSPVTVTKRADPPPDRPDGNSGVRRVSQDGCASPHPPPAARPVGILGLLPRAELGDRTVPQPLSSCLPHESGSSRPETTTRPAHHNRWRQRSSLPRVNPPEQQRQQTREAGPGMRKQPCRPEVHLSLRVTSGGLGWVE